MKNITTKEAMQELDNLNHEIKRYFNKVDIELDCENISFDSNNPDDYFMRNEIRSISDKLDDIHRKLNYLSKPISDQGYIRRNSSGRYELPSGDYFTSGSACEILYTDDIDNEQYWIYTRIEHNGEDYFATALGRDISINGMMVRVRR
ncbi:DUF5348 domain-containing protein [Gracilibacillus thailandensis]|uniref:DUF5348 domain-containing protein n=1 Tax=Gracilibacillus thailandensis TaxID=563735 RepID=A0A6N7QXA6_9BACI|nr:DUF5348 domain-containing protein [Gracilibacillus thailandensis]MRI66194.1 hypothetical protein [Gracilibacillus thailandensis]